MKIILDIKDPDAIIRDLRSVARVYRDGETSASASPVSGRLLALATIIESEAIAYRQAKDEAAQMLLGNMPGNDRCQICGEVGDYGGLPHGEVTGDGLTRDDVPLLEAPAPGEFADLTPRWSVEDGGLPE